MSGYNDNFHWTLDFPLTPFRDDQVNEAAYIGLVKQLADARVDSITALGSTGSYAYLTIEERARVAQLAVAHAGNVPVFIGVGALLTSHVLANIDAAAKAGAAGVLVAPMSYQLLTDVDVFELFRTITQHTDEKPATWQFGQSPVP